MTFHLDTPASGPGRPLEHETPSRSLAGMIASNGPLPLPEAVWWGVETAEALAVHHRTRGAHGAISAAAVTMSASGVVIAPPVAAVAEPGEPGVGALGGSSKADDIAALGGMLNDCVRPIDAQRLAAWTAPMLHADPSARPTAAMVARALRACAEPSRPQARQGGIAALVRERAASLLPAADDAEKLPEARWWRAWLVVRRVAKLGLGVGLAFGLVWGIVGLVDAATPSQSPGYDPAMPIPQWAAIAPDVAAAETTLSRFAAIAAADGDALIEVTLEGSPAREEALALAEQVQAGAVQVEGLTVEVSQAIVVSQAGRRATVSVTYTVGEYTMLDGDEQVFQPGYVQTVDLDLVWSFEHGWQVARAIAHDEEAVPDPEGPAVGGPALEEPASTT